MIFKSLPEIAEKDSKVLILGTMLGGESLRKNKYYADPSNDFWLFIHYIIEENIFADYDLKLEQLKKHKIAIWDVLAQCEREGSLDKNIKNEKPNNFNKFFLDYPNIKAVYFNGTTARRFYKKYIGFNKDLFYETLPSSSASKGKNVKSVDEKIKDWLTIKNFLKE